MPKKTVVILLVAVWLVVTGFCDLDWQLVSYRYSEWHRSVEFWEFCPFLRVNWWLAYQFSVLRLVVGTFLLGFICKILLGRKGEACL